MGLALVPRTARALSAQLNAYYRVLKGVDPDSVALRLPSGGSFEVRHSVTAAPVLRVTDAGFDAAIGTSDLADGAVTSAKIADLTITGGDIANNTITSNKLVTGAPITPGSITAVELAPNAVTQGAIAVGTTANPTTSAGSPTPLAQMSVTLTCTGGPVEIDFTGMFYTTPGAADVTVSLWVDTVAANVTRTTSTFNSSSYVTIPLTHRYTPTAAAHTFAVYYHINTGSVIAASTSRSLTVTELKR